VGQRILIIEDETAIADAVAARLQGEGFDTYLATDGLAGVELCGRVDPYLDLLVGLAVGADDYLTKPFSQRELVARIRAVLRRSTEEPSGDEVLRLDELGLELDVATRRVALAGDIVHLTPTEFDLVARLAKAKGAVLSRERLLDEVWGYSGGFGARTVDSHVRAVRRKLGDTVIRTVHAVGYAIGPAEPIVSDPR